MKSSSPLRPPIPIPSLACASVMVIIEGEAIIENYSERSNQKKMTVKRGDVIYIESHAQICFIECSESLIAFRTFSYEIGPDHTLRNIGDSQTTATRITVQKKGRAKYLIIDDDAETFCVETDLDGTC